LGPILNNHSLHLKANSSKQDYANYLSTSCHKSKCCCNKVQSKCAKLSLAYFVTISLIIWILSFAWLLATLVLLVAPFIVAPTLWTTTFFMEYTMLPILMLATITQQLLYRPTINSWPTILPFFCLQPWWVCIQICVCLFFVWLSTLWKCLFYLLPYKSNANNAIHTVESQILHYERT